MSEGDTAEGRDTEAGEAGQRIAASAENVRAQVRDLLMRLAREGEAGQEQLRAQARRVFDGAMEGATQLTSEQQQRVMREVVQGLADGFAGCANAFSVALDQARERGQHFAREDVQSALEDLRVLDGLYMDTMTELAERAGRTLTAEVSDLRRAAEEASEEVRKAAQLALETGRNHPGELASGAASASLGAARKGAGTLLHAVSDVIAAAGDRVKGDEGQRGEGTK